jgi:hypothetical protein
MHLRPKLLLMLAVLLAASSLVAQERYRPPDPGLMTRLSYDNSGVVQDAKVLHVCIEVSHDGEYRLERSSDTGQMQRIRGKMLKQEFEELFKLLRADDFRNLSGYHSDLVRQRAETFAAEIPEAGKLHLDEASELPDQGPRHWQWMNGDGENPFPVSVSKVADWLQRFQPKDGKSFEYAEYPDVCPRGGLRFLQPSLAGNKR